MADMMVTPAMAAKDAVSLAFLPATVMFLMSIMAMYISVPVKVVAGFQHLAAGIVMSAIAVELVPMVMESENTNANIAGMIIGFMAGISAFLIIGAFCEEPEDDDDDDEEALPKPSKKLTGEITSQNGISKKIESTLRSRLSQVRSSVELAKAGGSTRIQPYPSAIAFAVCLDAFIDGFLIGISSASGDTAGGGGSNAGLVMAIALTIEMGFLGLTFAMGPLKQQSRSVCFASILAPPCLILLGCIVGAFGAAQLASEPALHVGLVSFGIAALLYLVTEELLLEAHESLGKEEHVWWVDLLFFVGFIASFVLEKVTDE